MSQEDELKVMASCEYTKKQFAKDMLCRRLVDLELDPSDASARIEKYAAEVEELMNVAGKLHPRARRAATRAALDEYVHMLQIHCRASEKRLQIVTEEFMKSEANET